MMNGRHLVLILIVNKNGNECKHDEWKDIWF